MGAVTAVSARRWVSTPPMACSPVFEGQARVIALGQEHVHVVLPERDVVVAPIGRDTHERLGHEAGEQAELTPDLFADLPVGRETVGRILGRAEGEVELQLAGRVLVVALDHVQPHGRCRTRSHGG